MMMTSTMTGTMTKGMPGAIAAVVALAALSVHAQIYRPGQEYRSLNTALYEIAIQKNGRLDITYVDGDPIFTNVFPMVWFADEEEPELLPVNGRYSGRYEVNDALGRGQGMVIARDTVEWALRTYPTQPFLAVQVAFRNTGDKPVQISALYPFCVGEPKEGIIGLGPGSAAALLYEHSRFRLSGDARGVVTTGNAESDWLVAAFNAATARSIAVGFLTANRGFGKIELREGEGKLADPDALRYLRAACVFDPPVTVAPEESLLSEVVYISLAESDPYMTVERFARAVAVANGLQAPQSPPMGWDLRGMSASDIRAFALREDVLALKVHGWRTLWIDLGGSATPYGWQTDSQRLGGDFAALAGELNGIGYHVAAVVRPFTASADDPLLRMQPDWFVPAGLAPGAGFVLNATLPEVREHLAAVGASWRDVLHLNAVVLADTADLAGVAPSSPAGETRLQVYRAALESVRAGFGGEGQWAGGAEPAFLSSVLLDGYAPADAWSTAAQNYYLTPQLGAPLLFLDDAQPASASPLLRAALVNAGVAVPPSYAAMPARRDTMARMLPQGPRTYFRPSDWMSSAPEIWFGPYPPEGATRVVALAGAGDGSDVWLPFAQAGIAPTAYVSVFDLRRGEYQGTARDGVTVASHPGETQAFALQPVSDRPVLLHREPPLLSTVESTAAEWDASTRMLRGRFDALERVTYTMHFLMPENVQFQGLRTNIGGEPTVTTIGRAIRVTFAPVATGKLEWSAQFSD